MEISDNRLTQLMRHSTALFRPARKPPREEQAENTQAARLLAPYFFTQETAENVASYLGYWKKLARERRKPRFADFAAGALRPLAPYFFTLDAANRYRIAYDMAAIGTNYSGELRGRRYGDDWETRSRCLITLGIDDICFTGRPALMAAATESGKIKIALAPISIDKNGDKPDYVLGLFQPDGGGEPELASDYFSSRKSYLCIEPLHEKLVAAGRETLSGQGVIRLPVRRPGLVDYGPSVSDPAPLWSA